MKTLSVVPLALSWNPTSGFSLNSDSIIWFRAALPSLTWRAAGESTAWRTDAGVLAQFAPLDPGVGLALSYNVGPLRARIEAIRLDTATWRVSTRIHSTAVAPVELARFHYFEGALAGAYKLLSPGGDRVCFDPQDTLPSPLERFRHAWMGADVEWAVLEDPYNTTSGWGTSTDVGLLAEGWDAPALLLGVTGPGKAFGEIAIRAGQPHDLPFYAGLVLDGIRLDPGESLRLDDLLLHAGDWQDGMERWARCCVAEFGARPAHPPLLGYCSWYQVHCHVRPEHISQALREYSAWPLPPGGATIQLDDGFQLMPADWRPNERFANGWAALPGEIAAAGFLPGLWIAPTAVFHTHPLALEHPDWLQRLPDGRPAVSFSNWGWCENPDWKWGLNPGNTLFLDPDQPEAIPFMQNVMADVVSQGWQYLKLDFTGILSNARRRINPKKTRFESLREMYQAFRAAAGPDTLLCACTGDMSRFALGLVDTARMGGDNGSDWSLLKSNMLMVMMRRFTNGAWWQIDPDVFHMRAADTRLSAEESWLVTGTIGLLGGVFLTSDFPSQWDEAGSELVRHFWNESSPQSPTSTRAAVSPDGLPAAFCASYASSDGPLHRVGLYNWADVPQDVQVDLADLRLDPAGSFCLRAVVPATGGVHLEGARLLSLAQPPHSLRIVLL